VTGACGGGPTQDAEEKNFVEAFQAQVEKMLGNKGGAENDIPIPGIERDKGYAGTFKELKAFHQPSSYVRSFNAGGSEKGAHRPCVMRCAYGQPVI
jgi:hypothetical protein